jgi:alpha-galactosidase
MAFRPGRPAPDTGAQGEGLLAVIADDDSATLVATDDPRRHVPSIRAAVQDGGVLVTADGPVSVTTHVDLATALASWAEQSAARYDVRLRSLAPGWCSWYGHGPGVTQADVTQTLRDLDQLDLPVDVVQLDDGYQAGIGDWLTALPSYGSPWESAREIEGSGRTPGVWTAPFLVGADSDLARAHPGWLVGDAVASDQHWGQLIRVLDVTHPEAQEWLQDVFRTLFARGFRFFKLDFLYGGAMDGRRSADCSPLDAYVLGLQLIRDAVGPEAVLLGCGAPLLPSIGLVDAMRVSPDVAPEWDPPLGDVSQPGMSSALLAGRARAWQQHRLWTLDPDCLLTRPSVGARREWAEHVRALGGLAILSDRLEDLDHEGVELARQSLRPTDPSCLADVR